ncbi:hypothetical protein BDQ17DRAFT_973760 [Cyathus striatus]|nr:hypothetical protein BDQ17DRAFT_973760 [Cyathus striatus]
MQRQALLLICIIAMIQCTFAIPVVAHHNNGVLRLSSPNRKRAILQNSDKVSTTSNKGVHRLYRLPGDHDSDSDPSSIFI